MKNKYLKVILCAFCIGILLMGCNSSSPRLNVDDADYNIDTEDNRFLRIDSIDGWIYVDKETNVQYIFVKRGYGGGLTVMLDSDGSPLLYEK